MAYSLKNDAESEQDKIKNTFLWALVIFLNIYHSALSTEIIF